MKPTIGRIVHCYMGNRGEPYPAMITKVLSDTEVDLIVFGYITGPAIELTNVILSDECIARSWIWPPKV